MLETKAQPISLPVMLCIQDELVRKFLPLQRVPLFLWQQRAGIKASPSLSSLIHFCWLLLLGTQVSLKPLLFQSEISPQWTSQLAIPLCGLDLLYRDRGKWMKFCIERGWHVAEGGFWFMNYKRTSLSRVALFRVMKTLWLLAEPPTPHSVATLVPL